MTVSRMEFYKYSLDVTHQVDPLKDGRANAFGWSASWIDHMGTRIGELYCGFPKLFHPDYTGKVFEYEISDEEWAAAPDEGIQDWLKARKPVSVMPMEHAEAKTPKPLLEVEG